MPTSGNPDVMAVVRPELPPLSSYRTGSPEWERNLCAHAEDAVQRAFNHRPLGPYNPIVRVEMARNSLPNMVAVIRVTAGMRGHADIASTEIAIPLTTEIEGDLLRFRMEVVSEDLAALLLASDTRNSPAGRVSDGPASTLDTMVNFVREDYAREWSPPSVERRTVPPRPSKVKKTDTAQAKSMRDSTDPLAVRRGRLIELSVEIEEVISDDRPIPGR